MTDRTLSLSEMQLQNVMHCVLNKCSGYPKLQKHHLHAAIARAQLPLNDIQTTLGPAKKMISTVHQYFFVYCWSHRLPDSTEPIGKAAWKTPASSSSPAGT